MDSAGLSVMRFQSEGWSGNLCVRIAPEAANFADLSLLAVAALYLMIIARQDAVIIAASSA